MDKDVCNVMKIEFNFNIYFIFYFFFESFNRIKIFSIIKCLIFFRKK